MYYDEYGNRKVTRMELRLANQVNKQTSARTWRRALCVIAFLLGVLILALIARGERSPDVRDLPILHPDRPNPLDSHGSSG